MAADGESESESGAGMPENPLSSRSRAARHMVRSNSQLPRGHSTPNARQNHIPDILARLSHVERILNLDINESQHRGHRSRDAVADIAALRSLLAPGMHGSPRDRDPSGEMSLSPGENAPLYSHRDTQTHDDVMGSLSLRRDLSHPENPRLVPGGRTLSKRRSCGQFWNIKAI
uniref:Uncharacterized protein n=1 Tax=Bionectria ochroleuca TaxID=29856 RepID=A0A8H7K7N3_BIOOC